MIDKRRLLMAGATLVTAIGIGHFMQSGGAASERFGAANNVSKTKSHSEVPSVPVPLLPTEIAVPALAKSFQSPFSTRIAALDQIVDTSIQSDVQTPPPFVLACDIEMQVTAAPGAMIDLDVKAPCHGNTVVNVQHAGLKFTGVTNALGQYQVMIPAIQKNASVAVGFADGQTKERELLVPDLDGYVRAALLWTGGSSLHIHALEFGADYGEFGHVWAEDARSPEYGLLAKGGFLTHLGEANDLNAQFAEVYSFPADRVIRSGAVRIIVEASITDEVCGTNIAGRTIEVDTDGSTKEAGLELTIPDCDAIGGYLVLKNLLQDLKIARN